MSGMGTGFGNANVAQTVNNAEANSRANRQQEFKDRQIKIMEDEQAKQQQNESGFKDLAQTVQTQQKELTTLKRKQGGDKVKGAINYASATPDVQSTVDAIKKIESDPEALASVNMQKGDIRPATKELDLETVAKDYISAGASREPALKMAQKSIDTGMSLMYKNVKHMDIFSLNEKMGTSKDSITPVTDKIEENKNNILKAGDLVDDLVADGSVSKDEANKIKASTSELGKMTNKEAQADLQVTPDLLNGETQKVDTTKNVDGSDANVPEVSYPMSEPVYDDTGKEIATKVEAPDGSKVTMSTNDEGTDIAVTEDGTTVTKNEQGGGTAVQADGTTTTFDGEKTVTVSPTGIVTSDYVLPRSVQMAYDMMGLTSSFSEKAQADRELIRAKAVDKLDGSNDYAPSPIEKYTEFYSKQINPITKKLNTSEEALVKAETMISKDKSARLRRLREDLKLAKKEGNTALANQIEDAILAENASKSEVARKIKTSEINTAQEYAENVPMDVAITAYSGKTSTTPQARDRRRKSKEIENKIDFSTEDKAALDDFRKEVSNHREFARAGKIIEDAVASGKYKSGPLDTMGKNLSMYLPKDVNDFVGSADWFESAIADKNIDAALANYIRMLSGLTVSDNEYNRLKSILKGDYTSEESALATIQSFNRRLSDSVYDKGDSLYQRGYLNSVPRELALMQTTTHRERVKPKVEPTIATEDKTRQDIKGIFNPK